MGRKEKIKFSTEMFGEGELYRDHPLFSCTTPEKENNLIANSKVYQRD